MGHFSTSTYITDFNKKMSYLEASPLGHFLIDFYVIKIYIVYIKYNKGGLKNVKK